MHRIASGMINYHKRDIIRVMWHYSQAVWHIILCFSMFLFFLVEFSNGAIAWWCNR